MLRFRLSGIPFAVTPYFWLGSAIFGAGAAQGPHAPLLLAVWVLCVFVSIVLHELGHALAARQVGVEPYVVLYQMGGLTYLPGGAMTRPQHIYVSLAGPAAGFFGYGCVLAARYYLGTTGAGDWVESGPMSSLIVGEAIDDLKWINGGWTLFNLLPILPLDGGQVLRDVLGPRLLGATRVIGGTCAAALAYVMFARLHQPFIAFFLGYLAYSNFVGQTRSLPGGTDSRRRVVVAEEVETRSLPSGSDTEKH